MKKVKNETIKKKWFMLLAIISIVAYNGADKWYVPTHFKEKIKEYERFGSNLLDFEYILLDVDQYDKEELIEKQSIASASEEKLELKNWIRNTLQEEVARQAIEILNTNKKEVNSSKV